MFNFFRKIRKQLLRENSFIRYSRYAIGEIVLVMVGILLALQVNNWNEFNKIKQQEIKILKELKRSISSDLKSLKAVIAMDERKLAFFKVIKREILLVKPQNDSITEAFAMVLQNQIFKEEVGPYEVLKSKGLSLISNDSIREQIISLYEKRYNFVKNNQKNKFIDEKYVQEYNTKLFDNIAYADRIKTNHYYREIKPHNFDLLKSDKIYNTILNTKIAQTEYLLNFVFGNIKSEVEIVLTNLDKEIDRLEN